jgi:hypothetical protein
MKTWIPATSEPGYTSHLARNRSLADSTISKIPMCKDPQPLISNHLSYLIAELFAPDTWSQIRPERNGCNTYASFRLRAFKGISSTIPHVSLARFSYSILGTTSIYKGTAGGFENLLGLVSV